MMWISVTFVVACGGGATAQRHVPSPTKLFLAGDSHLRAMAPANRIYLKVVPSEPPCGTAFGTPKMPQKPACLSCLVLTRRRFR